MHDFVVGIHSITGPNEKDHVWIERDSHKVVTRHFLESLKIDQLISDDDVFNSAVVSFGSFGIIHSVLVETEEIYQMKLIRQRFSYDAKLVNLMTELSYKSFDFPDYWGEDLNHLQVVLDPYKFDALARTGSAIITYGYKLPTFSSLPKKRFSGFHRLLFYLGFRVQKVKTFFRNLIGGLPNDVVRLLAKIDEKHLKDIPLTVEAVLALSYKSETQTGTLGELFTGKGPPSALAGSTMCVDPSHIEKVLQIFQRRSPREQPEFAGIYSLRFVKSSQVTLAGNHFGNITCAIEADGLLNEKTWNYYHTIWDDLRKANIPFRFHLGKLNDLDSTKFISMYDPDVKVWQNARNQILTDPEVINLFLNDTMKLWGLS